jgi:hypothetical protein
MATAEVAGASAQQKLRCAVYIRKSSEEGLEMEFNSLDAQREPSSEYFSVNGASGV